MSFRPHLLLVVAIATALPSITVAAPRHGVRTAGPSSVDRSATAGSRGGDRDSHNRVNTGDMRIDNDTNVNINADNNGDWGDWNDHYHPVARGVAVGTAAAVSAAVVGSMMYSLPPSCTTRYDTGVSYSYCGGVWYAPQYQSDRVVNDPIR